MNVPLNKLDIPGEAQYLVAGAIGLDERSFGSNASRSRYEILECLASVLDINIITAHAIARHAKVVFLRHGRDALRNFIDLKVREVA